MNTYIVSYAFLSESGNLCLGDSKVTAEAITDTVVSETRGRISETRGAASVVILSITKLDP